MKALIGDKVLKSLPNENHDIWNSRCRYRVLPPFATVLIAAFFWSFPTAQAPSALVATTVPVDSPALVFSPANWSGDSGRRGNQFRQTWNSGAYFRFSWSSTATEPTATILFDTSMFTEAMSTKPMLAYEVDGVWTSDVEIAPEVPITRLKGAGRHLLTVYVQATQQDYRWGTPTIGAANVVRLTGIRIGANDHIEAADRAPRWILEIGDSITEGIAANDRKADALSGYAYLIGQALQARGYEFGISACGWSAGFGPATGWVTCPRISA